MRRSIVLAVALALSLALAPGAQARGSFCSPSGDYCKGTSVEKGKRAIGLSAFALYAPGRAYELCVRDPRGDETCRTFRLSRGRYGIYSSKITWSAHFPTNGGKGRYRVRWDHAGLTYGPPLHFTRR